MKNKSNIGLKIAVVLGLALVFALSFMFLGMLVDIQIILRYDHTPISFTLTFLFVGALIGLLAALKTINPMRNNRDSQAS